MGWRVASNVAVIPYIQHNIHQQVKHLLDWYMCMMQLFWYRLKLSAGDGSTQQHYSKKGMSSF
jgi:hypothetical protein